MQLGEAIQRGQGLYFFAGLVLSVGFFQLSLLRQRRAGSTAFKLFEQRHSLVVGARGRLISRFGVDALGCPFGRRVVLGAGASRQSGGD